MVKVEIVDEKEVGQSPYASSSDSRTSSSASISSVESDISVDESFFDRVAALVDIVPPTTRHSIASRISKTASIFKRGGQLVGNIVWVVTTSALLVALPLALTLEDEAKIVAQEKEMLEQQQGAQQVCFSCLQSHWPIFSHIYIRCLHLPCTHLAQILASHNQNHLSLLVSSHCIRTYL